MEGRVGQNTEIAEFLPIPGPVAPLERPDRIVREDLLPNLLIVAGDVELIVLALIMIEGAFGGQLRIGRAGIVDRLRICRIKLMIGAVLQTAGLRLVAADTGIAVAHHSLS